MATFSDFELQQARNFFAGSPSPSQIYQTASNLGLSANQLADLYSQVSNVPQRDVLQNINQYLISTNQALTGGYSPGGGQATTAGTTTGTTAGTTTGINTGVTSNYTPGRFQPYELQSVREFLATNPTADEMFNRASALGLSAQQFADLYTQVAGGNYGQNLSSVQDYLTRTGKTLFGGYKSPETPITVTNPPPPTTPLSAQPTGSRIDPALYPYLQRGLQRAEQLFLTGAGPQLYPEQMFVSPSAQTLAALGAQERLAAGSQPVLEAAQRSYLSSLMDIGETASGGFLAGSPYRAALITAATRPLTQQYTESVVPGIASGFSRAGRYGSGAMERAQSQAAESFARGLGDISSSIAAQDYARERGLQQQAQIAQSALAQAAPGFFQASFMPSQALAQVGAAREAISAQPLQERIQRYQYGQQLPYQQLQGFLSSVYGTPMAASQYPQAQTNRVGQAIGGGTLGYLAGQAFPGSTFGIPNQILGAAGGALLGGLL